MFPGPYVVPDDVLTAASAGGMVVLNPATAQYHFLNVTGETVLAGLRAGQSLESVAEALAERFGLALAEARRDCEVFVAAMVDRGLLTRASC